MSTLKLRPNSIWELTDEYWFQGPLGYLKEVEAKGAVPLVEEAKKILKVQDFGVSGVDVQLNIIFGQLLGDAQHGAPLDWRKVVRYLQALSSRCANILRYVDKVSLTDRYDHMVQWTVPDRDDPSKTVTIYQAWHTKMRINGGFNATLLAQAARHLMLHEVEEQMLFAGVRLLDPHALDKYVWLGSLVRRKSDGHTSEVIGVNPSNNTITLGFDPFDKRDKAQRFDPLDNFELVQ